MPPPKMHSRDTATTPISNAITCPFCGFDTDTEYAILLHMETRHAEGKSPFVVDESPAEGAGAIDSDASGGDGDQFAECPVEGCEEIVTLAELDDHIEFHAAEAPETAAASASNWHKPETPPTDGTAGGYVSPYSYGEHGTSSSTSGPGSSPGGGETDTTSSSVDIWRHFFGMSSSKMSSYDASSKSSSRDTASLAPGTAVPQRKRLGKAELGKYAHEKQMPDWLVSLLKNGKYVSAEGVIPVLQQLLEQNPSTVCAWLCHPAVQHISKLRKEGGFCGYRNIQMLSSYIVGANAPGAEHFHGRVPSIFRIQDLIEDAWDKGVNAQGRVETGGVRGTRKYIGTPEAQAMFGGLGIPVDAQGFKTHAPIDAEKMLFDFVERYFESGAYSRHDKVRCTALPPIYFQHRGHSLTIIGFEKHDDGSADLLVFDPMFHDSESITDHAGRRFRHKAPDGALKPYRRGRKYLKKYNEFEILRLRV
ncbi:peptidase family C78-domain-containing protein [Biscogniauxia sp. FL1348]|nr:peptidase family C78-domain-containing protein [Biscogniauxia sp. FL1348]